MKEAWRRKIGKEEEEEEEEEEGFSAAESK